MLVNCQECGGRVSENASVCPHCGTPFFMPPKRVLQSITVEVNFLDRDKISEQYFTSSETHSAFRTEVYGTKLSGGELIIDCAELNITKRCNMHDNKCNGWCPCYSVNSVCSVPINSSALYTFQVTETRKLDSFSDGVGDYSTYIKGSDTKSMTVTSKTNKVIVDVSLVPNGYRTITTYEYKKFFGIWSRNQIRKSIPVYAYSISVKTL